jgi:hypothetical protein
MTMTYQESRKVTTGFRLSPAWRKSVLVVHVVSGIGWMGLDVALAILLLTGLTTDSGVTAASAYNAVGIFAAPAVLVLANTMLLSGLLLGWGTKWGLVRYWWVFIKLLIGCLLVFLVWFALVPELNNLDTQNATLTADQVRDELGPVTTGLLFPPFVSFAMLLISVILSMFKPWGKTRWTKGK